MDYKKWILYNVKDGAYRGYMFDEYGTQKPEPGITDVQLPDGLLPGNAWKYSNGVWEQVVDMRGVWIDTHGEVRVVLLLTEIVPEDWKRPAQHFK